MKIQKSNGATIHFNPWIGCTKVSPACLNCYAERDMDHRYKKVKWGQNGTRVMTSKVNWNKPRLWNRCAELSGKRYRVFCASLADVFEDWRGTIHDSNGKVICHGSHGSEHWFTPDSVQTGDDPIFLADVRERLFSLIDETPYLDWLLLTKRPENVLRMWPRRAGFIYIPEAGLMNVYSEYRRDNVWIGTSVENQEFAEKRIPELVKLRDLSPVLFLSCEPLVGPVNFRWAKYCPMPFNTVTRVTDELDGLRMLDWVITGGESGPSARPANPDWFRLLRDQCASAGVPFHFKQWGEFDDRMIRVGKKKAGRLLDGRTHDDLPLGSELHLTGRD